MADEFCLKMPDLHVTFRDLLHAINLRHGTNGFTSLPKEGVLRIFRLEKSDGFGRVWTRQHATSTPPKPLNVSYKIVHTACSRIAVGESTYWWLFIFKFKTVKFRARTNSIYEALLDLLQKYGLSSSSVFFFLYGTTVQCGTSPPQWTSPFSSVFRPLSNL